MKAWSIRFMPNGVAGDFWVCWWAGTGWVLWGHLAMSFWGTDVEAKQLAATMAHESSYGKVEVVEDERAMERASYKPPRPVPKPRPLLTDDDLVDELKLIELDDRRGGWL